MSSSLMLRYWSTLLRTPRIWMSFLSSTVTSLSMRVLKKLQVGVCQDVLCTQGVGGREGWDVVVWDGVQLDEGVNCDLGHLSSLATARYPCTEASTHGDIFRIQSHVSRHESPQVSATGYAQGRWGGKGSSRIVMKRGNSALT